MLQRPGSLSSPGSYPRLFGDTNVRITDEGRPHLGAPLGSPAYITQFISDKVKQWTDELKTLSTISSSQPHAAFAALTHGMSSKWSYLSRTTPCISQYLEKLLQCHLIPKLTGRPPPNKTDRDLFALAARLGGLGIIIPSQQSDREFKSSMLVTAPLTRPCISLRSSNKPDIS